MSFWRFIRRSSLHFSVASMYFPKISIFDISVTPSESGSSREAVSPGPAAQQLMSQHGLTAADEALGGSCAQFFGSCCFQPAQIWAKRRVYVQIFNCAKCSRHRAGIISALERQLRCNSYSSVPKHCHCKQSSECLVSGAKEVFSAPKQLPTFHSLARWLVDGTRSFGACIRAACLAL